MQDSSKEFSHDVVEICKKNQNIKRGDRPARSRLDAPLRQLMNLTVLV